uniref:Uncharacterized protein n=1 Tax=Globisporangium ultimum (strain ATCC 200006 / CBS 805.95 / DAOM BR144) TaxID=431595 RepID=K3W8C3_GLOUD
MLPPAGDTPSAWYFLSLMSVSVFVTHDATSTVQTNFVDTERKGEGSNVAISMLKHYLEP